MRIEIDVARPSGPGDAAGVRSRLAALDPAGIVRLAVLGKVEGPATLNDFSRDLALSATEAALHAAGGDDLLARSCRIYSTGCEGIASPLTIMIASMAAATSPAAGPRGLVMGAASSARVPDNERCGRLHIDLAADATRRAMAEAGLAAGEVRLVLLKSPVLSPNAAGRAPGMLARHAGSTGASRGAAAIGAGIALGEISPGQLGDDPVGRTAVFATRTMSFSGTEADGVEVVVLGTRAGGDPRWRVDAATLADIVDWPAGAPSPTSLAHATSSPRPIVFFKAGIPPTGHLRGRRTTVLTSDLTADKQLRAAASGIVAARFGDADAFISAGAEHQGPPGSCLLAVLTRT